MRFVEDGASLSARPRRSALAFGIAGLLVAAGAFAGTSPAFAAEAVVSQVGVSVSFDGTGPFDADDAPGHDSGDLNGVVRSVDQVEYLVASSFAAVGDATYVAQLPVGMAWDATATADTICTGPGGGAISADKQTLTCSRTATAINESFKIRAWVDGAGNDAMVAPVVTVGGLSATAPAVRVSAEAKTEVQVYTGWATLPSLSGGQPGAMQSLIVSAGAKVPASGQFKGYEGMADSYSFFVNLPAHAKIVSASDRAGGSSTKVWVDGPTEAGGPSKITVSGHRQGFLNAFQDAVVPSDFRIVHQILIGVWTPYDPGLPVNIPTPLTIQVLGFDPDSASGASNFGSGYALGQDPSYACPADSDLVSRQLACVRETVTRTEVVQLGSANSGAMHSWQQYIYGDSHGYPQNEENVVVGQPYIALSSIYNGVLAGADAQNAWGMIAWDPKIHQLTGPAQVRKFFSGKVDGFFGPGAANLQPASTYRLEYSDYSFANDTARRTTDPATLSWVSDPSVLPGGPTSATAIRMTSLAAVVPNTGIGLVTPFIRSTSSEGLPSAAPMPWFWQYGSDETARVQSTYTGSSASTTGGSVRAADALIRSTAAWGSVATAPGEVKNLVVTPTIIGPVGSSSATEAKDVKIKVTLDTSCAEPVWSAVKQIDGYSSHTPANVGPDGIACTADDGAPAQVVFSLGNIEAPAGAQGLSPYQGHATALPGISIPTMFSPLTPSGINAQATVVVSASNDKSVESYEGRTNLAPTAKAQDRTEFASIMVQGVASFSGGKTALTQHDGYANPNEEFSYTINWGNGTSDKVGNGTFVDLLPYNGDSRGTTGMPDTGFTVITATASTSNADVMGGVSIEFTTDRSEDVAAALVRDGNSDGHTGINWKTGTVTSKATALRFVTEKPIDPGFAGSATITVSVDGLAIGGVLKNDFYGKTAELSGDPNTVKTIIGAAELTLRSSAASLAGTVYRDHDFSGTVSAADTTWKAGAKTLTISNEFGSFTSDVAADGSYDFGIVPGGDYTATMKDGSGWALVLPVPISLTIGEVLDDQDLLFQEAVAAPTVVADKGKTSAGQGVVINVKTNDTWPAATAPSAPTGAALAAGGEPAYGQATLSPEGSLSYTAAAEWPAEHAGADSYDDVVTYVVTNAAGGSAQTTVTITVYPAPAASADLATVPDGKPSTIDALANDAGNTISLVSDSLTATGDVTAKVAGDTIEVTPTHTWAQDEATYEATVDYSIVDSFGQRSTATVTVTVQRAPVVTVESEQTIASDGSAAFNPALLNPGVVGADGITVSSKPEGASVTVGDDGTITFEPGTAGVGEHTFTVDYVDNLGQKTSQSFTVTVYAALVPLADEATVRSDTSSMIDVLANDVGDGLTIVDAATTWAGDPAFADNAGTVTVVDGRLNYRPKADYPWADNELSYVETLSYVVEDAHGSREAVTVEVTVIRPPSGVDRHLTVEPEFEKVIFDPIGEATGTGLKALSAKDVVTTPANGSLQIVGGVVHYTPTPGFVGDDSFVVRITDSVGQTTEVQYTVTVLAEDGTVPTPPGTGGESEKPMPGGSSTPGPNSTAPAPDAGSNGSVQAEGTGPGLAVTGNVGLNGVGLTLLALLTGVSLVVVAKSRGRGIKGGRV